MYAIWIPNTYEVAYSDQYYVDEYPNTNDSFGVLGNYVNQTYGTDLAQDINVDGVSVKKLLSVTRSGYILWGIALDKAGKKPVIMADSTIIYNHREDPEHPRLYGLATKNKATVTLYAVWDKVVPSKPAGYTASFANGKLTVKSNEILDTDTA